MRRVMETPMRGTSSRCAKASSPGPGDEMTTISKEIVEFSSGKDPDFQPERRATPSPGPSDDGRELIARRRAVVPVEEGKRACHSDLSDREEAQRLQAAAG